jgi:hypothetical protein
MSSETGLDEPEPLKTLRDFQTRGNSGSEEPQPPADQIPKNLT